MFSTRRMGALFSKYTRDGFERVIAVVSMGIATRVAGGDTNGGVLSAVAFPTPLPVAHSCYPGTPLCTFQDVGLRCTKSKLGRGSHGNRRRTPFLYGRTGNSDPIGCQGTSPMWIANEQL